jgi:uncharacterized protein YutE (UPF0331/DUF86 family)
MICFMKLGTPGSYADAFRRLQQVSMIDASLADRLVRAAGFRNCVAYAYETLDMTRVTAAPEAPADLRAFLALLRGRAAEVVRTARMAVDAQAVRGMSTC